VKILVLGLSSAAPDLLFGFEDLPNIRRLMGAGAYGRLESLIPPSTVPAWMGMATSQDSGSLGVYDLRNRINRSYASLEVVSSASISAPTIWDEIARGSKRSVIIGVPPSYPPRRINGISVGCFLSPDTDTNVFTHPAELSDEIRRLVGHYPVDVDSGPANDKSRLRDQTLEVSRTQFRVARQLLRSHPWDYFQFVDIGLNRIHHHFWNSEDSRHDCDSSPRKTLHEYYRHLDDEIGRVLELLSDETIVIVLSEHGAQRLDGGFCVNEWLVREGLLELKQYPEMITPFDKLKVNWDKTKAWSEGGCYAPVFLNVKGREPQGVIQPADYDQFRDELKERLEATVDPFGKPLGTLVFRPEEIYHSVRNVGPDLIVHFGGLSWRSIGEVGHPELHVLEKEVGLGNCNNAQIGAFILAAPNSPLQGETSGARLLDIAPTLLELGGYDIPRSMQGRSLISGTQLQAPGNDQDGLDAETLVRERLSGLGYI
jgi:predicted AlkP superfamily phosphohydrolase/phosphomutase